MTEPPASLLEGWHARLAASRGALLRALEGVTERDFAAPFDGDRSLVQVLARLAVDERTAVAVALGGERAAKVAEKPLPPQVIHDLAGARYQTERLLVDATANPAAATSPTADRLAALVEEIAGREQAMADRIASRPRA